MNAVLKNINKLSHTNSIRYTVWKGITNITTNIVIYQVLHDVFEPIEVRLRAYYNVLSIIDKPNTEGGESTS